MALTASVDNYTLDVASETEDRGTVSAGTPEDSEESHETLGKMTEHIHNEFHLQQEFIK